MKSPHLDPEWLRQKYQAEGLSTYDIGKLVGRDPKRIYEKLRDFGIPTRPRGENLKGADHYFRLGGKPGTFKGRKHTPETRRLLSVKASCPKPWIRGERNGMFGRCGPLNPNYKDGSSPERQRLCVSSRWKCVVRRVRKRDNDCCHRCAAPRSGPRSMHMHHVKPWAGNPELRFEVSNVVSICRACHEWLHSNDNFNRHYLGSLPPL